MQSACKVGLLGYIKVKRQTLPEINVHAPLFGTLEYGQCLEYLGFITLGRVLMWRNLYPIEIGFSRVSAKFEWESIQLPCPHIPTGLYCIRFYHCEISLGDQNGSIMECKQINIGLCKENSWKKQVGPKVNLFIWD